MAVSPENTVWIEHSVAGDGDGGWCGRGSNATVAAAGPTESMHISVVLASANGVKSPITWVGPVRARCPPRTPLKNQFPKTCHPHRGQATVGVEGIAQYLCLRRTS